MRAAGHGSGVRAAAVAVALLACAGPAATGEKGRLVPLDVPRAALAAAQAPRRLALAVGVARFDDPAWRPLRYPEADAAAVADVLRDPGRGAFDDVRVLVAAPTRGELRDALRALEALSRDERDTVVVYVSSHGTLARDASGALRRYLVLRDTRVDDVPGTALPMDELKAAFDRIRSRRKLLVLAACHSGSGKSLLPPEIEAEARGVKDGFLVRPIEEVSRATVVLAASDWGETAREDERLGHDIYTHFLVEALRVGADRNGDGAVTASEAHDYARRMTYAYTEGRQRPSAESSEVGVDPIVLVGRVERKGLPELYSYADPLDGFTVRVDGEPAGSFPGGVVVTPGRHRVQLAKGDGRDVLDRTLRLGVGERVDVGDLVLRRARFEIAPRIALLSFADARSRADAGTLAGAGATFTYRDWPAPRLALRLDATWARGAGRLRQGDQSAPFRSEALAAGASLPWRFDVAAVRGASLFVGPRLSAVLLRRRFGLDLAPGAQSILTFAPGLVAGAGVPLGAGVVAGLELQLDWALLRVDGADRSSAFVALLAGAGWRF